MPKVLVVGSCGSNLPALHSKIAQLTGGDSAPHPAAPIALHLTRGVLQLPMASLAAFASANFAQPMMLAGQV